ncbi:hypothetical protein SAMN05421787_11515 [Virgibacillus pantothenticus]|nr:hypothetical protein SAMN05421787_11515 [Virgibacillus pantothenticus]
MIIFLETNLGGYAMTLKDKRIEWKIHCGAWKESRQSIAEWCRGKEIKKLIRCIVGCNDSVNTAVLI